MFKVLAAELINDNLGIHSLQILVDTYNWWNFFGITW